MPSPVAIVTGAGSGIGRETCMRLAQRGYRVMLVGRTESKLDETVETMARVVGEGPPAYVLAADISDSEQAGAVVDMAMEQWGRIDVLVNNAGVAPLASIDSSDPDLLYQVFAINTFGPARLISCCWPIFGRQHGGRIVNVSSMATADPFPGFFAYAASKSALESFTRSINNEGQAHGIRAFSVAPGAVETPMLRASFSPDQLPETSTLDPTAVADVIVACAEGERDADDPGTIYLPSP